MATIHKRSNSCHVQIRKKGHPPLTNSFKDRKTALEWAKKVESEIDRYIYLDISTAQRTTVSKVLDRYQEEILPTKRGRDQDSSRITTLKAQLGKYYLADLRSHVLAENRDKRLNLVKPSTVRKELGLLSRVLTATIKDWGIDLPNGNPAGERSQRDHPLPHAPNHHIHRLHALIQKP